MYRALVALMVVLAAGPAVAGMAVADSGTAQLGDEVDCEFPVSVEDETGQTVTVDEEPESVVVTLPNAAQHMWEIGAQDKVVGMPVNPATAYLEGYDERENIVGDDFQPDIERIVALEPDLVLVPFQNDESVVENLRDAGLTVYYYPQMTDLDSMYEQVETVGQLVGEFETAASVTAEMAGQVDAIEETVGAEESVSVYYEFFEFTAGPGTLEDNLITLAGGENIAGASDQEGYFQLSEEIIETEDPEWLVLQEGAPVPDSAAVQNTTAIQQDNIVRVNPNFISQHGPRNIEPLTGMAEAFHSEAMAELDLDAVEPAEASQCAAVEADDDGMDDTATDETADDADDEVVADDAAAADDDGVGFTVGAALVAVLTVAVLARRRP